MKSLAYGLLIVAGGVSAASATSIPVTNYNFSSTLVTQNGGYYDGPGIAPTGWSSVGFSAQYLENAANGGFASNNSLPAPPGTTYQPGLSGPNYQYVADDSQGTLYQDLGVGFLPNTTYTVDASAGHRAGFSDSNITNFGLVSSTSLISASGPASLLSTAGFINVGALPNGTFNWASAIGSPNAQVFTYTTGPIVPAGDLVVYFNNPIPGSNSVRMDVGGISVTAVPEPASLALLAFGAAGLLIAARRRRSA